MDAASDFFGEWNVPRKAITMGVETILSARTVVLLACGEGKAPVIRRAVEGEVTAQVAASYLQQHPSARIVLDAAAASELTRFKTPWLLGPLEMFGLSWDERMTRTAAIWLAHDREEAAAEADRRGLQRARPAGTALGHAAAAYDINIEVFKTMQATITGWPGGKPRRGAGQPTTRRPRGRTAAPGVRRAPTADVFPKRVVVFSPHPDDDVISMGGTLIRLCEQGHEVHVAYQTSGNIAVFDDAAVRHADFVAEYCRAFQLGEEQAETIEQHIESFIGGKKPGEVDSPELQQIKGLIRRTEARAAAKFSGVQPAEHPLPGHAVLRDRPRPQEAARRAGHPDHRRPAGEGEAAPDLRRRRPVRPARHAPRLPCRHLPGGRAGCADRDVDEAVRGLALPRRLAGVGRARDRDGRPAQPRRADAQAHGDLQAREPEGQGALPRPQRHRASSGSAPKTATATPPSVYDQLGLAEYEAIEGFVRWQDSAEETPVA